MRTILRYAAVLLLPAIAFPSAVVAQAPSTYEVKKGDTVLALANNRDEMMIHAELNLAEAGCKYAQEALLQPVFLRKYWKAMLAACRKQLKARP